MNRAILKNGDSWSVHIGPDKTWPVCLVVTDNDNPDRPNTSAMAMSNTETISLAVALIQATPGDPAGDGPISGTLTIRDAFPVTNGIVVVRRKDAIEAALAVIRAAASK